MDRWRHTDDKIEQLADFSLESKAFWLGHDKAELMPSWNAVKRTIECLRIDIGYGKEENAIEGRARTDLFCTTQILFSKNLKLTSYGRLPKNLLERQATTAVLLQH